MHANIILAGKTQQEPVYYRRLGIDDVEWRWDRRRRPGEPFTLVVRSRVQPDLEARYPIEDAHAPVDAYLILARVEFAAKMQELANEHRERRRATEDERARTQREILAGQKRQSFGQEAGNTGKDDETPKPADRRPRKKSKKRTAKRTKKG